jgi:phenylacetate-CoA ligase
MIRKLIARHIGFPLQDYTKKTSILSTLKTLKRSENYSEKEMNNHRLLKLQKLVKHAYDNVPYYTELFDTHNISPSDIKSLEDITIIPVLTKEIARANQEKLVANHIEFNPINKGKTGGTTGVPLVVYSDTNNRSFTWASYYRWYNWIGLDKEDAVLSLWGSKTILKPSLKKKYLGLTIDWVQNNKTLNTYTINEDTLPEVYAKMLKFDPVLIKGYLSAIILIGKYMQKHNLPPNKSLRALSSTTETLLPMYRDFVQGIFKVPIYDQYGCGEVSAISYECQKHKGLHINEEHVYIESLNESNKSIINETGRLVVTSLDNYVMPFIRYENGDMATLLTDKCTCGLNSALMKNIEGRTVDTIRLKNGANAHGVFFTSLLYEVGITTDIISRFQIIQFTSGAIDFYIESKENIDQNLLKKLKTETLRFVTDVNITVIPHIPNEPNGKFKYIKQDSL